VVLGAFAGFLIARRSQLIRRPITPEPSLVPQIDQRFDRLVRALPLGVLMLDIHGRIIFANRSAGMIFGFDPERAEGLHVIEVTASIQLERRANEALAGEASMGPLIVPGKVGSRKYAVSAYPMADEGENIGGALILAEDQTELLAIERARQEFLSSVSHELRTPLSSIKLMLETVSASPDDATADLFLPQALGQVDRLVTLVNRFLEQARAESGDLRLEFKRTRLDEVIRPIVQSFEPQAAAAGVKLVVKLGEEVFADIDGDRIGQVVVNLVDNALRFTSSGGAVKIELARKDQDARIVVADTGIGIPFKDLPHIFERFYVVDPSRTRASSGAGLGLSIVKQIAEGHGGTITARSLLGSGARFVCRIPLTQAGVRKA